MGNMIKVDPEELMSLSQKIMEHRDKFLLLINNIYRLQNRLESSWNQEQAGSFQAFINDIKGSSQDIIDYVDEATKQIGIMIQLADDYNSRKIY